MKIRLVQESELQVRKELSKLKAEDLFIQQKFNNIMEFAKEIMEDDNKLFQEQHPIFDVIRILGRGIQSDYMRYLMYFGNKDTEEIPNLEWDAIGFPVNKFKYKDGEEIIGFEQMKKEVKSNKKIHLEKDLILPWPWKRERLVNCIKNIGKGRRTGKWRQDYNHTSEVWLPMGICWVIGGNHSIAVGIVQGGELKPTCYYDISEIYKYVKCDGNYYINTTNDVILGEVKNVEFAAIFEIGRLMKEKGISFIM